MFYSRRNICKHNGLDREGFLFLLVDEYFRSTTYDAKCQILANLANFGYDPMNYEYISRVGVLDIFLYVLKFETDGALIYFACAGINNVCLDLSIAEYILSEDGIPPIAAQLKSTHDETVGNAIGSLIYLCDHQTVSQMQSLDLIPQMEGIAKSENKRLVNLATIFLKKINGIIRSKC